MRCVATCAAPSGRRSATPRSGASPDPASEPPAPRSSAPSTSHRRTSAEPSSDAPRGRQANARIDNFSSRSSQSAGSARYFPSSARGGRKVASSCVSAGHKLPFCPPDLSHVRSSARRLHCACHWADFDLAQGGRYRRNGAVYRAGALAPSGGVANPVRFRRTPGLLCLQGSKQARGRMGMRRLGSVQRPGGPMRAGPCSRGPTR